MNRSCKLGFGWMAFVLSFHAPFASAAAAEAAGLGPLSCAATACHGSVAPDLRGGNIYRNEYVFWFENDPHADGTATLQSPRSRKMFERLGIIRAGQVVDTKGYANCLACHSPMTQPSELPGHASSGFGVSCESCHGSAETWLDAHYRLAEGGGTSARARMVQTKDLDVRARLCANCHVGAADRQVDHDLIAAGHPALKFELAAYSALLPKHWNDSAERQRITDFEVRLWAAGQLASAQANLDLLQHQAARAAGDEDDSTWPDYAHYDCYACHHDLATPSWRQHRGDSARKAGTLPWESWYFRPLDQVIANSEDPRLASIAEPLKGVRRAMESSYTPDPARVHAAVDLLRENWAQSSVPSAQQSALTWVKAMLASSADRDTSEPGFFINWDVATQHYLAAVAWQQSVRDEAAKAGRILDSREERLAEQLSELRRELAFPGGWNSPRGFGDATLAAASSPTRAEALQRIVEILEQLQQQSGVPQ